MTRDDIKEFIEAVVSDDDVEIIIPDELDEAFVGLSLDEDNPRSIYSIEKCIEILSEDMGAKEAEEFFWYNVAGTKGDNMPLFIHTPESKDSSSWTISSPYLNDK